MAVEFPYGDGFLPLAEHQDLKYETVYPINVAAIDTSDGFQKAISRQNNLRNIGEFIRDSESAAISVETRYLGSMMEPMLTELLNRIVACGISHDDITIIFNKQDIDSSNLDYSRITTTSPLSDCTISQHNPSDSTELAWVGETKTTNDVMLCESYVSSDFRVGVGAIVPDAFIGVSGGGTAVVPNIAGFETIRQNHRLRLQGNPRFFDMRQPASEDITEAAHLGGLNYVFNIVLGGSGSPVSIAAGAFPKEWNNGVETSERLAVKNQPDSAPIVIVGSGGSPYDNTAYDAIDCLTSAAMITQHGGTIILVAQCSDGLGPKGLEIGMTDDSNPLISASSPDNGFRIGMEKARVLRRILETRNLILVGEIQQNVVEGVLRAERAATISDAVNLALTHHPSYPRAVVIPNGRFVFFR